MIQLKQSNNDSAQVSLESLDDCRSFAKIIASILSKHLPSTIALVGTLGAGKTQLVKFFAQSLGANPEDVFSPTFVLIHPIGTTPEIYHVDAYRIHDSDEFLELGIEELFEHPAITIVEWADRFALCMPRKTLWIQLQSDNPQSQHRHITLSNLAKLPALQEELLMALKP